MYTSKVDRRIKVSKRKWKIFFCDLSMMYYKNMFKSILKLTLDSIDLIWSKKEPNEHCSHVYHDNHKEIEEY